MSNLIRCPVCAGQKKIRTPGLVMKDCKNCFGVGHVKAEDVVEEKFNDPIVFKKTKPGRKKAK